MATVHSRQDLADYVLRNLGAPVVQINVDDDQLDDRLDEALQFFNEYSYDGVTELFMPYQITQADIDNQYIPIPDYIYGIAKVLPFAMSSSMTAGNIFDLQYQIRFNDMRTLTSTSVANYVGTFSYLSMIDQTLNGYIQFRFNRWQNRLNLDLDWKNRLHVGEWIVIQAYRALDPVTFTRVYNDRWLKAYTTALVKRQWAMNVKKYQNMQLPGGVTIDGQSLYDEAVSEIAQLEQDLIQNSAPCNFFMG